jgi:hypothetical protein
MKVAVSEIINVRDQSVFLRMYIRELMKHGVLPEDIDYSQPNIYRQVVLMMPNRNYYAPPPPTLWNPEGTRLERDAPLEADFEVNMMECLVGWKGWNLNLKDPDGWIFSPSYAGKWKPEEAFTATCTTGCKLVPREHHTCGIYATDKPQGVHGYGKVKGMVYGWGRYVRGGEGWRSQFAYPKSFHLTEDQVEFIEPLKKYHVPIYINQPVNIYNPEEDGYEHWNAEANGNSGAAEIPPASEAGDSGEDDED